VKVLIIDDEEDIRRIGRLALARVGGMEVSEAADGAEGLRRAAQDRPDVVLLDLMMPGMDGAATLQNLRADPATSAIPVVFLTAKAQAAEIAKLKGMGALGVLTKPFDPMTLAERLKALLTA
jgi:CheY-like chemotaxis protein